MGIRPKAGLQAISGGVGVGKVGGIEGIRTGFRYGHECRSIDVDRKAKRLKGALRA